MGARKQSTQTCGHQFAETLRTSKGQSGTICRGKDERGCSREDDIREVRNRKMKRAQVDPTIENEETFMNRVEVKVKIPEELKPWFVDDWDLITRQKQVT